MTLFFHRSALMASAIWLGTPKVKLERQNDSINLLTLTYVSRNHAFDDPFCLFVLNTRSRSKSPRGAKNSPKGCSEPSVGGVVFLRRIVANSGDFAR